MEPLISEEYRRLQEELHLNPNYGVASVQFAPIVTQILKQTGDREVLDYGAGKGRLGAILASTLAPPPLVHNYDPAQPQWSTPPSPCGFVACIDVLEHIEPECLDAVLDDLRRVTRRHGFFTVHTGPAVKVLADGRNAHLIQQPPDWWLPRLMQRFELLQFRQLERGFWVFVAAKQVDTRSLDPA